ncbi:MAG TPA: hypothetical protein VMC79_16665 [Rectinemataceae bacterium]|nr:hypothetical protein [Rectinemataceae bacterium]
MAENAQVTDLLTQAALVLYDEAYKGPSDSKGTWFVDNEPDCGMLGMLERLGADEAGRPLRAGDPASVASHAGHLLFALSLANRAARGENPYPTADWGQSWATRSVDASTWPKLVAALRAEYLAFRDYIASGKAWKDADMLTGTLGQIAHGAWHLGAIRQALGLVVMPSK